jgi:hypothetical protein
MYLLFRVLTLSVVLIVSGCASTNALWNDSGSNKTIGFWLYGATGSCPSIRKNPPIVFASKQNIAGENAKEVSVGDLGYCFELSPKVERVGGNNCESGSVSFTYLPEKKMYSGTYNFKFTDGTSLAGKFLAEYCPKADDNYSPLHN